jgi:hypothetical protein
MIADIAVYVCGIVTVSGLVGRPTAQIHAGYWFFLVGSCVVIVAALLVVFGYGWKRFLLFAVCLLSLFLWVGFTLY